MTKAGGKLLDLDDLAAVLAGLKAQGRRVVHSHGVFDLLHIGHIRHFQSARALGDVLVVTLTEDRYVNKGPHRPAFPAELRAEAVAALDSVDYVAVNRWPTAVETIALLQPDVYVKGREYADSAKDITGKIADEEAAVRAVGGRLAFTDDLVFSSSTLMNQFLPQFPDEVREYLKVLRQRLSAEDVLACLERASKLRVLVVGETIIDEYQSCEPLGKSSKEPVLAVLYRDTERYAGGTLAVANHVAGFAREVSLVSVLGLGEGHEAFVRARLRPNVQAHLIRRDDAPTIVKRRYLDSYLLQKLFEVYEMNDAPLAGAAEDQLVSALTQLVPGHDVVIVADYGHGMMTPRAIAALDEAAGFLALNIQVNAGNQGFNSLSKYPRADYVCISEREIRMDAKNRRGDVRTIMAEIVSIMNGQAMLVTQGSAGAILHAPDQGFVEVPALATRVVDRVGAGDAVLSVSSLCVALGASLELTGLVANAAGAEAVAIMGNRSQLDRVGLSKHIVSLLK